MIKEYKLSYIGIYRFYEEKEFIQEKDGEYILENLKDTNRFDYKGASYKYTRYGNISKGETESDVNISLDLEDINVRINGDKTHLDLIYKMDIKKLEDHVRITTKISSKEYGDLSCLMYIDNDVEEEFIANLKVIKNNQEKLKEIQNN